MVSPYTGVEIRQALAEATATADDFWNAIPTSEFFASLGGAWSPADNVRHLVKSVRPLARGLGLPPWLLRLRFGRPWRPSRTLDEVVRAYGEALRAGGTAGRFTPSARPAPEDPEEARRELMETRRETEKALQSAVARWSEQNLDAGLLPHPLLGPLTVREMLLFTIYHGIHHARGVARRKGIAPPAVPCRAPDSSPRNVLEPSRPGQSWSVLLETGQRPVYALCFDGRLTQR